MPRLGVIQHMAVRCCLRGLVVAHGFQHGGGFFVGVSGYVWLLRPLPSHLSCVSGHRYDRYEIRWASL